MAAIGSTAAPACSFWRSRSRLLVIVSPPQGRRGQILGIADRRRPLVPRDAPDPRPARPARRARRRRASAEARAAAAAERGRLAREMHDVLAHSLSALALQLESTRLLARKQRRRRRRRARDRPGSPPRGERPRRGAARDRDRSAATSCPGPSGSARSRTRSGSRAGCRSTLEIHGEPRELAPDARLAVYRTAQEALTNVRSHATAERVAVSWTTSRRAPCWWSRITPPPGRRRPSSSGSSGGGYGLTGMRERAELLGGELRAEPTADGFRVELRLPRDRVRPTTARSGSCSPTTSGSCARASARCSGCSTGSSWWRPRPTARRRSRWPPSTGPTSC